MTLITIDVEKFAGLNFHGFNPTHWSFHRNAFTFPYPEMLIKSGAYIHGKKFHGTLENCENLESLTQWIFPHLQ